MRLFFTITLLLSSVLLRAQESIDSALAVLRGSKADTGKVRTYVMVSKLYYGTDPKKGFAFADSALALSQHLQYQRGIAESYNLLGLLTGDTGNNTGARAYFEKSLAINRALGARTAIIANLNNIGRRYSRESDYTKAAENYFQAMALADSLHDDAQAALVGTNLTSLYILQQDYKKAAVYAATTIKRGLAGKALIHVSKAHELLAVILLQNGDTLGAKRHYDTAMAIDEQLGNTVAELTVLANLGATEPDPKKAIPIFLKAQRLIDSVSPSSEMAIVNLLNLGINYTGLAETGSGQELRRDLVLAHDYLERSDRLSVSTKNIVYESDIQEGLAHIEELEGHFQAALEHYKRFKTINDSVFSQENKNKIAGLESQRAIDLKNEEIQNRELQIANQRKTLWLLVVGVGMLGVIGGILYRQGVTRKKTNTVLVHLNHELSAANKVKAKFFAILSHDLRSPIAGLLNFLQLQKRKPGSMSTSEIAEYWEKVGGSASALLETMEAMLLWSKGQMEHFKPRIVIVGVADLFARLERLFAETEGVTFSFVCEGDPVVDTDEDYLWTIMQNLTANAIKAVGQTPGARIDWRAWREGSSCFFSISDNGPGVAPEQLKALYADDTAITGARQGLGLHIIRDLAKAIRCVIELKPQAAGTMFVLGFGTLSSNLEKRERKFST
jgi:signal transduction histidine kinase